jgi:hypothetical protein
VSYVVLGVGGARQKAEGVQKRVAIGAYIRVGEYSGQRYVVPYYEVTVTGGKGGK